MVTLPRATYNAMLTHVQGGYPNEACGILAAIDTAVVKHYPAVNASTEPQTFSIIDGPELFAINKEIELNDWTLFSYYHSHPATEAYPSPRDIRYSQGWPGTYYLIFSLKQRESPILRAYLIAGEQVDEHEIVITD